MTLAIFDLDNTLIAGDSDYLWGKYLVDQGIVDPVTYEAANVRFYEDYKAGTLDINAFLLFALKPLSEHPRATLEAWRSRFLEECILPIMLPAAKQLIAVHKTRGDTLMIITATNAFVTRPIAQLYGIDHLIATEPKIHEDRYTGTYDDIPCFQDGKVKRLDAWLASSGESLLDSWFYSDSHNDLPLLERVTHPVAVDPDAKLSSRAAKEGWPVITLRNGDDTDRMLGLLKKVP